MIKQIYSQRFTKQPNVTAATQPQVNEMQSATSSQGADVEWSSTAHQMLKDSQVRFEAQREAAIKAGRAKIGAPLNHEEIQRLTKSWMMTD